VGVDGVSSNQVIGGMKRVLMGSFELSSAGVTDTGRVRKKNEDSILVLDRFDVFCVADGMGGVSGGEIASQKVTQSIKDQVCGLNVSVSLKDKMLGIHQAVIQANEWILGWSAQNGVRGAGTTLVLLVLSKEFPWAVNILHAGDSRAYRYRGRKLEQITADHSIEEAVGDNSGQPLPSQFKGLITNAVGLKKPLSLELTHAEQKAGDIWLLCSDGLNKMLSDKAIAAILASGEDADTLAHRFVNEANAAGGKDNVSVVVVKVLACSKRPASALSVPFPGPLPAAPEEDVASTETSMTETNGSVLMSLETPQSDTDFMTHDGRTGRKTITRWLLLALAAVSLVVVLWKLLPRHAAPGDVEELASTPPVASIPATGTVTASSMGIDIEKIVAKAQQSGDWEAAYIVMQQGNYSKTGEHFQSKKAIDSWYRLVWEEAKRDPDKAKKTLPEFIAAANKVLAAIDRKDLPPASPWPKDSARIANEFCRRRYNCQQLLTTEVGGFLVLRSHRINFIQTLPDEHVATAFRVAGFDARKYEGFDQLLRDAKYAVKQLDQWLKDRESLPITKAQLESLPDSRIKYCIKAEAVVSQLMAVLQKMPELKGGGTDGSEAQLQEELNQIQLEWRSCQEGLKRLESGNLSASDERSIRKYLEALYAFEAMVGSELNILK
jgi:protein phosphatase